MAKKRQGLTENNVSPKKIMLDPVRPCSRCEELQEIATNLDFWLSKEEEKIKRLTKELTDWKKKLNTMKQNKHTKPKLERDCEYQLPNCQKITDIQYIKKLGSVTISKHWICENCKKIVEEYKDIIK